MLRTAFRSLFVVAAGLACAGLLSSCAAATPDRAKAPFPPLDMAQSAGAPGDSFRPFYFVQVSDPHLGFRPAADERFAEMVAQINRLKPDFVALTGDLTYGLTQHHQAAIDSGLAAFQPPVKLIPGNHDVGDRHSLETYRQKYGRDYYVFTHNNCDFIFLDSMTLDAQTPYFLGKDSRYAKEAQDQWAWLEKMLAACRAAGRQHIFLLLHIPPFVNDQEGGGKLACMSPAGRTRLLELAGKYGVQVILAGHIHRTVEVRAGPLTVYTVGGTYWPIDRRGHGYRVFKVERDRVTQRYVRLDEALEAWKF